MAVVQKFHWFWPFQDEQEERWLISMAGRGYHLVSADGFGRYTFETGQPGEVVYRLDTFPDRPGFEDPLRKYAAAGWEQAGQRSGWRYFRRPLLPGEAAQPAAEVDAKIERYRRISTVMLPFLAIWIPLLNARNGVAVQAAAFVLLLVYLYILTGFLRRIRQLRKIKTMHLPGPGDDPGSAARQE